MHRDCYPDDDLDSQELDTEFAAFEQQVARVSYAPPGQPLPRVGQQIAGKYRVDGLLGCGGMGAVFSVTHQGTGRPFAIKWLLPNLAGHPEAVQRFKREARACGKIVHPNVIQVYDIGDDGESHYIVMELVHGVTLADRLHQRGRFSVEEACRVLIPVMRGVHAAHQAGVVHRDLKPQNIMLAQNHPGEEVPKVLDFGISKILAFAEGTHSVSTRGGAVIGTPHYMSLEQLRSARVDARSDVYALGVVAYHVLSGALPFSGQNYADLVCQILGNTAVPLDELVPDLPAELAQLIARAMSIEPDERFATVEAMAHALEPFAAGMQFAPHAELETDAVEAPDDLPVELEPERDAIDTPTASASLTAPVELPRAHLLARGARSGLFLVSGGVLSLAVVTAVWLFTSGYGIASTEQRATPRVAVAEPLPALAPQAEPSAQVEIPDGWEAPETAQPQPQLNEPEPAGPRPSARPVRRALNARDGAAPSAPLQQDSPTRGAAALRIRRGDFR